MDTEKILIELSKYGKPSLSVVSKGWHCRVDLTTGHPGACASIGSEYRHSTPHDAATECLARLQKMIGFSNLLMEINGHGD